MLTMSAQIKEKRIKMVPVAPEETSVSIDKERAVIVFEKLKRLFGPPPWQLNYHEHGNILKGLAVAIEEVSDILLQVSAHSECIITIEDNIHPVDNITSVR